jgi:hypothetical protein
MTGGNLRHVSDLVTYYLVTFRDPENTTVLRRRPDPEHGGRVDEFYRRRDDEWRESRMLRHYQSGRDDGDVEFMPAHPGEAERMVAWVRDNRTGPPPLYADFYVETAWQVTLEGRLDEADVDTVLARFGMIRLASRTEPREPDLGLRVLRADTACRWSLEFGHYGDTRWIVTLRHAGPSPDDDVIRDLRTTLYALVPELGLTLTKERVGHGLKHHWMRALPPRTDTVQAFVLYRADLDGQFTRAALDEFRDALGIEKVGRRHEDVDGEYGADDFFGDVHRTDGNRRTRLSLERHHDDSWHVILCYAGLPPTPEALHVMIDDIRTAIAQAGLTIARE